MQQQQQVGSCSLCGCSNFAQNPWLKSHRCSNCQHEHDSPSFLPPAADGRNTPLATTTTAAAAAATNRGGRLGPVAAATARGGGRGAAGGRPSFRAVGGGITSTQTHPSSPSDKSDNGRHCESDPHPLGAPTGAEGSQTLLSACAASGGIGGNHRPLPPPPASFVAPQVSAFCSPTAATSSTNGSDQAPFLTTTAISSSDLQTHHSHQQQHQHHQQQLDEEMEEEESAEGLEATAHTHEKQVHSRVPEQQTPQDERTLPQMPRKTHRDHLATELVDSERIYVKNLALLIRTFLKPLRAGKHRLDMSTVLEPTFGLLGEVGSLGLDISTGGRGLQQGEGGEQSPQQDVRNDEHHHRASSTSMEERIESANPMTATASTNAELSHSMLMRTRSFTTSFFGKKEGEPLLSEEQITILCSNIEEIYGLNKILLKDLENRMESWDRNNTLIGDIFLELTPYLKNYVVYARMNEGAQTLLLELENNSSFVEFLHSWERLSIIRPGNLRSFLILPIQRIPRYELFLKDLVKHTQEDHPDYYNLCQALQKVKGVNHIINDNIRQAKNRLKIVELQHSLVKKAWQKTAIPQLVAAHRTFVKEGTLTKSPSIPTRSGTSSTQCFHLKPFV
ncbi:guanine nucleotide exchange factor 9, variant 3 [Balamuthia mandrillaris]